MKSDLFQGRYLFHFHTQLTDGKLQLEDYFSFAQTHNIDQLIVLEHIRKNPKYDAQAFIKDFKQLSIKWKIKSFLGFESKILPDGTLDISEEILHQCDAIGIAEHAFPDDFSLYRGALEQIFQSYPKRHSNIQFVWVHPGLWLHKRNMIDHACYPELLHLALENHVLIEKNSRYKLPVESVLSKLPVDRIVLGVDAHCKEDLDRSHLIGSTSKSS